MNMFLSSPTLLFTFFSSLILITIYIYIKYISSKKNFPPSPLRFPIIGNLHNLGSSPHRSLAALFQKHGPLMLLHLGTIPTLVASSSKAAQEIMKTHDSSFASRPNSPILNILLYNCKDIAFSPNGEYWRQLKSLVASQLLSTTQVKSFKRVREHEIGLMIDAIGERCGPDVNMSPLFDSLAVKIMCRVALGRTYDGMKLTNTLKRYLTMFTRLSIGSYIPWLWWVDRVITGLLRDAEEAMKEMDVFLEWLPFGAGRRTCPGVLFSVVIIELAIANIVYKFDIGLPDGVKNEDLDMSEMYGITVHRKFPLKVVASPRF